MKSYNFSLLLLPLVFVTSGCDVQCNQKVEDVAKILNTTGRSLSLSVCKDYRGAVDIQISEDNDINKISLGQYNGKTTRGGISTNLCRKLPKREDTPYLRPLLSSADQVKLCYNTTEDIYVIIESNQICASDEIEREPQESCPQTSGNGSSM